MHTYGRLPFALSHGKGCWVWDTEGRRYLDGLGGIAVNTLGHNHPKLVPALQDQVAKLIHCSNYYFEPMQRTAGRQAGRAVEHGHRVLLQFGPGSQRRRAEDRPQVRP
jgi:acetylornithine/succinyldiaminopimelate/putrescine aminotransferase